MNIFNYDKKLLTYNKVHDLSTNYKIISLFQLFIDFNKGNQFKVNAYKNAINNIKQLNFNITKDTVIYLKQYKLVGLKLYDKIIEFLETGHISSLDKIKNSEFLNIKGFGPAMIIKLNKLKIYKISELEDSIIKLTHIQKLGIKYRKDLSIPIPRDEITILKEYLDKNIFNNYKTTLVGSYRRNQPTSSDIDIVLSCKCGIMSCLEKISLKVMKLPNYIDKIILGKNKFSFLIKGPTNLVRQVDILAVHEISYYTAILHFTGNAQFNQKIRSILKQKNILINEYYILLPNKSKIYPKSEKEIFDFIGIKYLIPENRLPINIKFI